MPQLLDLERQLKLGSRPRPAAAPVPAGDGRIPYMTGSEARATFLRFFEGKGHTVLPSYPLLPSDDPSILWINCGMAPLKPFYQGLAKPPNVRLATSQKSIRLNDIENVGRTPRHQTFFEMLGNFSIGDYFKRETIVWAWELVTEHYRLPPELLWITVHPTDDEAREIWRREVGLAESRIVDDPDNFWDIGPGPCGPNSELYIDRGAAFGCQSPDCGPLCECGRFVEFYNLVFTQFNHNEDGSRTPLPRKNIDTGLGLERLAAILQGVASNFETDLLWPLLDGAAQLIGTPYGQQAELDLAMRVIADHVRSVAFTVAEGPLPANEGRGYVIRRLLRRAARYGLTAGISGPFLHHLVPVATHLMADEYPEVRDRTDHLVAVVRGEEERFGVALREGMRIAAGLIDRARDESRAELSGDDAFLLYDTFGFPLDLTEDLADEAGLRVDREGFEGAMAAQRRRARAARAADVGWESAAAAVAAALTGVAPARFVGYDQLAADAELTGIVVGGERSTELDQTATPAAGEGADVYVSLAATPFYAESGGQVADRGVIGCGECRLAVKDVQRLTDGRIVHRVDAGVGRLREGDAVRAEVDVDYRMAVARSHTATHLVHRVLREVLGEGAKQAGSLVAPDRLRFDFTYGEAMPEEQLAEVERKVNEIVRADLAVSACEMPLAEAREMGAVALFGEKYDDVVRVVSTGDWSHELCGGTHVRATGQIGLCVVEGESSIGSGVRRIEAYTGPAALDILRREREQLAAVGRALRAAPAEAVDRVDELFARIKGLERENEALRQGAAKVGLEAALGQAWQLAPGAKVVASEVTVASMDELRRHSDWVRDKLGEGGVGVLAAKVGDKAAFVVTVGRGLVAKGLRAGDVAKRVAAIAGGSGGGRAEMAQAGGRHPEKIAEALAQLKVFLPELMA